MIKHVDMFGNDVLPGDYIAFAQRDGNSQRMAIAVVLKLDPEDSLAAKLWSGAMSWRWNDENGVRVPYFRPNSKPTKTSRLDECIVLPMTSVSWAVVRAAMVEAGVGYWFRFSRKGIEK